MRNLKDTGLRNLPGDRAARLRLTAAAARHTRPRWAGHLSDVDTGLAGGRVEVTAPPVGIGGHGDGRDRTAPRHHGPTGEEPSIT
jgi:hypothetical protein